MCGLEMKKNNTITFVLLFLFSYSGTIFADLSCDITNITSSKQFIATQNCLLKQIKDYKAGSDSHLKFITNVKNLYLELRIEEQICNNYLKQLDERKKIQTSSDDFKKEINEKIIYKYKQNLHNCANDINTRSKGIYDLLGTKENLKDYSNELKILIDITNDQYNRLWKTYKDEF